MDSSSAPRALVLNLPTLPANLGSDAQASGVLTVAQLNRMVAGLLEQAVPMVRVRGEISNFTRAGSGHWYFSIKDPLAQARAVMFRGRAQYVDFAPREGARVEIAAQVSLYQARGEFQLIVESMRKVGTGDLYQQFLLLKAKLQREGLFEAERKRAIPRQPRAIAVVTSAVGAALHDVLTTLRRRSPSTPVYVFPSLVQGAQAADNIRAAIVKANQHDRCDVLLLVRGGGSIEDLWAFNDESLARAIVESRLPVVCGVGHETDFTIADFVADLRAATPTAAAAAASPDRHELALALQQSARRLAQGWSKQLARHEQRLDYCARLLRPPSAQWRERQLHLNSLLERLSASHRAGLLRCEHRFERLRGGVTAPELTARLAHCQDSAARLRLAWRRRQQTIEQAITVAGARLDSASPGRTLARGYAIVRRADGRLLRSSADVAPASVIEVVLAHGRLAAVVERTMPPNPNEPI